MIRVREPLTANYRHDLGHRGLYGNFGALTGLPVTNLYHTLCQPSAHDD